MQPLIKVKGRTLMALRKLLADGEEFQVAVPCGRMDFNPDAPSRPSDRDYMLLTDRRLIQVPGAWFINGKGALSYPRDMIIGMDAATYLLGATVTFHVQPLGGGPCRDVAFPNCGKPEADQILRMFHDQGAGRRCPGCGRPLQEDFTFCPFCKTGLKRICRNCGKPQNPDWANCPYCGM